MHVLLGRLGASVRAWNCYWRNWPAHHQKVFQVKRKSGGNGMTTVEQDVIRIIEQISGHLQELGLDDSAAKDHAYGIVQDIVWRLRYENKDV